MKESLFASSPDIDTGYLECTYANDVGKAHTIFSGYLQVLPGNLSEFMKSLESHNIYVFREQMHNLIPLLASVGLTDVSNKLQELHNKCITAKDMILYEIEIQDLIKRIVSSTDAVEKINGRLAAA